MRRDFSSSLRSWLEDCCYSILLACLRAVVRLLPRERQAQALPQVPHPKQPQHPSLVRHLASSSALSSNAGQPSGSGVSGTARDYASASDWCASTRQAKGLHPVPNLESGGWSLSMNGDWTRGSTGKEQMPWLLG